MLVYSSAISCFVSLILNAVFCKQLGAGSAVMGYTVYIVIQMSFYYLYFNNKILGLSSLKVFRSFIIPTMLGLLSAFIVWILDIRISILIWQIMVKSSVWMVLFLLFIFGFKVLNIRDVMDAIKKSK
jgi:peptidoglycan biosynthesis protein MviN/MurJ (putative lipid II flippase)